MRTVNSAYAYCSGLYDMPDRKIGPEHIRDAYSHLKNLYKNVPQENCDIGHNNFALMDRSNFPTAMIAGVENSGKTFSVKREAANTLFGTDDEVIILTKNPREYHSFAQNFHGHIMIQGSKGQNSFLLAG